jgi:hypothetical protein
MALGFPAEMVASIAAVTPAAFPVWPENMPIVSAFLEVATQWRTQVRADGRLLWLGLDYTAVRAGLELAEIKLSKAEWRGVGVMEAAASAALNERS